MTEQFYPGSRQRVGVNSAPAETLVLSGGKDYPVGGSMITLFSINELSRALNRSSATVRRWEREGIIPKAVYVKPGREKNIHGKRRLYSREQIEGLVRIAAEEDLIDNPKTPILRTKFVPKALALFKELQRR